MKSYPIWNNVKNCLYKSSKSYGNRDTGEVDVVVGSSYRNSHKFLRHTTTRRLKSEYKGYKDVIVFKFSVDDIVLKEMIFKNNNGKAGEWLKTNSVLNRIKGK